MEVKVGIKGIENLKTTTAVKEEKDKEGEVIDRRLITKVQFEAEIAPADLANVHRLLAGGASVHVVIGSPQAIMEVLEKEPAFSET